MLQTDAAMSDYSSRCAFDRYLLRTFGFSSSESVERMFSLNLKQLMDDRGVSSADLSKKIGVSKVTVYHWRNGNRHPNLNNLFKLVNFFNVDCVGDLIVEEIKSNTPFVGGGHKSPHTQGL